jgi:hypothetical protein
MADDHEMTVESVLRPEEGMIEVWCGCGKRIPLGYSPSIHQVADAAERHLAEVRSDGS